MRPPPRVCAWLLIGLVGCTALKPPKRATTNAPDSGSSDAGLTADGGGASGTGAGGSAGAKAMTNPMGGGGSSAPNLGIGGAGASTGGAGGASGQPGGSDGTSGLAQTGDPCSAPDAKACAGHASRDKLVCWNSVWTPNGSCDGDTRCETDPASADLGSCLPVVSACVGRQPGDIVCDASARRRCGVDLLDYAGSACAPHASCQTQAGSASCTCDAPYMDDGAGGCTVPICIEMPCQNGGICSLAASGRSCDCSQVDYSGDSCETKIDDCALNPCMNGGSCSDGLRTRSCDCSQVDYSGDSCETKRDDCALNPCMNGGACSDGLRSRTCTCASGFSGGACEVNDNECAGANVCSSTYPCVDYTGSTAGYTCRGQYPDWPVPTFGAGRFRYSLGVVTDLRTGLEWQQSPSSGTYTWTAAQSHCPNDVGAGWRLPTLAELLSIVDYSTRPPIDNSVFLGVPENYLWTASPLASNSNYAWVVFFSDGSTTQLNDTGAYEYTVLCVR